MYNFLDTNRLNHLLGWTLLGLLLTLLVLEGWRYAIKPSVAQNEQVIEQSLSEASDYFLSKQEELLNDTETLAATLQRLLQKGNTQQLYSTANQFPQFWSTALYQKEEPIVWNGFALGDKQDLQLIKSQEEQRVFIKKHNNVIYWQFHVPFSIQDSSGSIDYNLLTSYRIRQTNPLAIGNRHEFNLFNSSQLSSYPLSFSIFSSLPTDYVQSQPLTNVNGDSVGVVYATAEKFQQTQQEWQQGNRFWRSVFALFSFVILSCLLFWGADLLPLWQGLSIQLLFIGIGWGILYYTNMLAYWVLTLGGLSTDTWGAMVESISYTCTNAFFALICATTIARKINNLKKQISPDSYLTTILFASITGGISALGILSVFNLLYHNSLASNIPLLDLRILPQWGTIILYFAMGMTVLALTIVLITLNRLLFRATSEHFKLTVTILSLSFIISVLSAPLLLSLKLPFDIIMLTSLLSFSLILGISVLYFHYFGWISKISQLRKIITASFIIAGLCIPVLYQASVKKVDKKLLKTAQDYAQREDPRAKELTKDILTTLEKQYHNLSPSALEENRSGLQTRFTQTIQNFISPKWNTYSFNLQLVDNSGNLIADYATDLNSPNWTAIYNIPTLKSVTDIEQITKSSLHPIVQLPQLVNQQDYRTFYRGWIPVFGTSEGTPIAWILCSIYQERPEFNKPIRAVMASLTYENWNTAYLMQKYENGEIVSSARQGYTGHLHAKRTLENSEIRALQQDTLIYLNKETPEYHYRTLLWHTPEDQTIKVSTPLSDYRVILFTFFRFSFILLLVSGLLLMIKQLQLFTSKNSSFLSKDKRFQDRILDNFLLATLVFLIFLIISSHYAIKQQNQNIVKQELFDKLESLSTTVATNRSTNSNTTSDRTFSLDALTSALNVDASFYNGRTVSETTTPQIYQQHLLPSALPYDIYEELYNDRQTDVFSTVTLAGQSLLIGYRTILDKQKNPIGTIAIPTFLQSPKYDQQLLETTSYLILIYLFVFGLFILASTLISKKLTRPLVYIQRGLNKISAGNLDTKIPVTSNDEIGTLANAYNKMVSQLKNLQKELAEAEREAAWKEMAQQVAHEIKNPLTPMKLNVQHLERQLKDGTQNPEELKERVQKITANLIEQIQTLNNIASDFSKFSQPLDEDFEKTDVVQIASSVAALYEHDEKVVIQLQSQNKAIYVHGIKDELKRVIINLVKNAYEAMPEDGGEISLEIYQQHQHVFIEIEDNGSGIPEESRDNIFVPNFSTKSSGTGLGLAICKKIIEAHEGSISFASVEGEGTTFVIKLPQY
ncbi:ATP-binding protein [Fodinibius halophilus]|uniref:Signal transduction histidine-protein kinase/phosphatase MprB n=1 Tax=Fodinibius halophilus TaxID=1736908 RepID=A0A6M1T4M7_9BACT|nr:ATP-binding protein [Fodinibius halophilus]NGP89019.1 HAMP domain-containing protein [Fodinibius halophilus]